MALPGIPLEDGFNDWAIIALTPWSTPVLLASVLLLVAAWMVVARGMRTAPPARRAVLMGLRALGLLATAALLLEPGMQLQQVSPMPGRVAVVLDVTRSMSLATGDETGQSRLQRAQAFLAQAQADLTHQPEGVVVDAFALGASVEPSSLDALGQAKAVGDATDLWAGLQAAMRPRAGRPLAGVLLISDGADNAGLPEESLPAGIRDRIHAAGVPIHTLTVGAEKGLRDLAVASVGADDFAFVRNPLEVDATITARGLGALQIPVTLKRDGKVVGIQQATPDEGKPSKVTFRFEPREVGEAVYTVEVPQQVGEVLLDNNHRAFTLNVIRDRIRVLQVAGRPSWDERFLRQLLKENPSVDLISFFILRTPQDSTEVRADELSLIPFPTRELFTEELHTFDVVIFQNFNFAPYEMAGYLPNVRQFVLGGGGFAMVGGNLSFSEAQYDSTVLADVLPVSLPPGRGNYVADTYTPQVTDTGRRHPILKFAGTKPEAFLAQRPPLEGFNLSVGLMPGAEALLVHPAPQRGPEGQPVLSVREVGKGRTMALNTDSLWFWALPDSGAGGRGTAHRELWANAIRWLIGDPALSRVRVEAQGSAFDPKDPVLLTVRAFDSTYGPLANAAVEVTVTATSALGGAARTVANLKGKTGADGEWLVKLDPPGPGAYRARAVARHSGATLGTDEDAFLVRQADRELAEGAPRPGLMALFSDASGGTVVTAAEDVKDLSWAFPQAQRVHKRKTVPLWDRTWVAGLICLVLALEWVLRRRAGYA